MKKIRCLVRLIESENPVAAIIFCNTKTEVNYVAVVLQRFGYDADELSSDLTQAAREKVLTRVRAGTLRFLVATDVAARGIDIPELSHIFIYEPPEDPEDYIHRAGRTGRAGSKGKAVSLVSVLERSKLGQIAKRYGIDLLELPVPTDEDVQKVVSERVTALLESDLRSRGRLQTERMQRFLPLAQTLAEDDDVLALVAMLFDDYYQKSLHASPLGPPEQRPAKSTRAKSGGSGQRGRRRPRRRR
jgi:ATP-dependent RNA helicase DeaD